MESADDLIDDTTPETTAAAPEPSAPAPSSTDEEMFGLPDEAYEQEPEPKASDDNSAAPKAKEPKVADTPAAERVDEQLLADAELVGYTRAEAMQMSPKDLERSIRVALRNAALAKRDAVERMAEEPKVEAFEIDPELLDPNEYDPKIIGTIQKMKEHYDKQVSDLQQRTTYAAQHAMEMEQQAKARYEQEFTAKFDADIAALGMDDLFGKGTVHDIAEAEMRARVSVIEHMEMDAERYLRRGERPPSHDVLFQRAIRAEFGDRLIQQKEQDLSKKIEKRAGQIVPRPGAQLKAKAATGFAAVKDAYREILGREAGEHSIDEMVEA